MPLLQFSPFHPLSERLEMLKSLRLLAEIIFDHPYPCIQENYMSRIKLIFVAVSILVAAYAGVIVKHERNRILDFSLLSPSGAYRVDVKGINGPPLFPEGLFVNDTVSEYSVFADAYGHESVVMKGHLLHSRDRLDGGSFNGEYPERTWLADAILRLGHKEIDYPRRDEIVVINASSHKASSLILNAGTDIFLIFDLPSGMKMKLAASVPRSTRIISATAYWENNSALPKRTIEAPSGYPSNAQYQVIIKDDGIEMKSCNFDVSNIEMVGKEMKWIPVPKAACAD
jgi:hypothetical protein